MAIRTRAPLLAALLGLLVALVPLLPGGAAAPAAGPDLRPRPGAETAGDPLFPAAGNGGYDVRHHDLRLRYHPGTRRVVATATLRVRTTQPLSRLSLDLRGLQVTGVRVAGEPARWSRAGAKLRVVPGRPLAAGRTVDVRVAYRGRPGPVTDPDGSTEGWIPTPDGAVALGQPVGAPTWHPTNATPADKASYDVRVTVPRALQAVSTGRLVSRRVSGGLVTWHWRTAKPTPAALSTVAIGRFRRYHARLALASGPVPAWSFTDVTTGDAAAARGLLQPVLRWLEGLAGPYPFDAAGLVVDVHDAGYALETLTRPVFPGHADEATLVHELAHQWFGGSVTPGRWSDLWLSEGWATYAEWLWDERPRGAGPTAAARFRAAYTSRTALDRFWEVPPAEPGSAEHLFDEAVYLRGAMALHALRERVGERDFADLTRAWTTRHRHGVVSTTTFERLAEEVSGEELDTLFQDWLHAPTRPAGY